MRWLTRGAAAAGLAAVMVAGTALAAGAGSVEADADARVDVPSTRGGLGDAADGSRAIDATNGRFYGIRVNSMNLAAEAKRVACFEYAIPDLETGTTAEKYQLVRSVWRGEMKRNESCDEVLGLTLPEGALVRFPARMMTTRWIRDVGPNGSTPVGGFVGELAVSVTRGELEPVPLLALRVIGTQGLRPHRGDPEDATYSEMERCSAPLHDEGFYQGGFDRRGLVRFAKIAKAAGDDLKLLRELANARIIGTFEGRVALDAALDERAYRFCNLSKGAWWFDGLLGWRARRVVVSEPVPVPLPEPTAGVSLSLR